MSRSEVIIDAHPDDVFATLGDGDAYGHWVIGAKNIRQVEPTFPAPGARFHHRVGLGPLYVEDTTQVLVAQPPDDLVLEVRFRPVGVAQVRLQVTSLQDEPPRTRVTLVEAITGGWLTLTPRPLYDPLLKLRNEASLRKLKHLVERRARTTSAAG